MPDMSIALSQKLGVGLAPVFQDNDDDWPPTPQNWFHTTFNDIWLGCGFSSGCVGLKPLPGPGPGVLLFAGVLWIADLVFLAAVPIRMN